MSEWGTDIAIVADQYRVCTGNGKLVADGSRKMAAVRTMDKYPAQALVFTTYEGFVIAKVK